MKIAGKYHIMTPLERVTTSLAKFVDEHPQGCHCSACYALRQVEEHIGREMRLTKAIQDVFVRLEFFEEDATEAKHDKRNHNEPEMYYQQGKADAYRIAMLSISEFFTKEDLGIEGI